MVELWCDKVTICVRSLTPITTRFVFLVGRQTASFYVADSAPKKETVVTILFIHFILPST